MLLEFFQQVSLTTVFSKASTLKGFPKLPVYITGDVPRSQFYLLGWFQGSTLSVDLMTWFLTPSTLLHYVNMKTHV